MGEENDEIFWKMSKWEIENKKKIKICSLIKKKLISEMQKHFYILLSSKQTLSQVQNEHFRPLDR